METSEPATPVQRKKVRFVCLTPKTDLMPSYKCHLCQKIFGWLKVLRKHLKMKHDGAEATGEMKEEEDKVRCRLCNKRINRDLLTRHLTTVHNVKKSGKRPIFRGFLTVDGENWLPLYLDKSEKDPPPEIMLPIDDEGKISLYGLKFPVEEVEVRKDHDENKNYAEHTASLNSD